MIFASKTSRGMLPCLTQFSTVRQARIRQDDVKARTVSDTSHEVEMTQQWQHVYQFENHNHFKHNTHQYTTLIYFVSVDLFKELWPQRPWGMSFTFGYAVTVCLLEKYSFLTWSTVDRREGGGWPCSEDGWRRLPLRADQQIFVLPFELLGATVRCCQFQANWDEATTIEDLVAKHAEVPFWW